MLPQESRADSHNRLVLPSMSILRANGAPQQPPPFAHPQQRATSDLRVAVNESRLADGDVASDGRHMHLDRGHAPGGWGHNGRGRPTRPEAAVRDDVAQHMVERHYAQLRSMARHLRPDARGELESRARAPDSSHKPSYQRAYLEGQYVNSEERRLLDAQSRVDAMRDERERFFRMDQRMLEFGQSSNASDAMNDDAMLDSSSTSSDPLVSKKARRKEQCRVNQANYRKRKRMYETKLSSQIKILEDEIQELQARKVALGMPVSTLVPVTAVHTPPVTSSSDPITSIGAFYHALESTPWEAFSLNERRGQGGPQQRLQYPALQTLFDRQQQEFESMESFQWQWLWYREHFDVFHLLVMSSERLDAGDQVIIRISAQLHLQLQQSSAASEREEKKEQQWRGRSSDNAQRNTWWDAKSLVCPVLQQFEFHFLERELTRITSEIDWIAGVTALLSCPPEHTLAFLDELIDCTVNCVAV